MISAFKSLDPVMAAGILSRAALALENAANPAAAPVVPKETTFRKALLREALKRCGNRLSKDEKKAREQLADVLDAERDSLLGPIDKKSVLQRMATYLRTCTRSISFLT